MCEAFSNTSCGPLQAATAAPLRAGVKGLARGSAGQPVAKGARETEFMGDINSCALDFEAQNAAAGGARGRPECEKMVEQ